ncbi:hypothetical protein [Novosphingobium gossypii]|uniref:hypothetical protein n=1 Tax=Novosphingobium gossypii TaxID=1604774 RepID=UPI003D1C2DF6
MDKSTSSYQIGVRVPSDLLALIDAVAQLNACERPDAIRQIVRFGAPLIIAGKGVNLSRVLMTLEIVAEDCLARAEAKGHDAVKKLIETAQANLERHHV